ncbi:DUF5050 domain-containing protein [Fulvivirga sp. RKSG066]|uniref:TolB family protein n=1 Tax=Fulvivirga aurantia TaxID=2529383 RepID=UPI0012BD30F5|nr:DUF5050 domain-containing protein [Fulvivirga aurantia]MTI22251.1 DUF5050 domain-containing protein [Fulvivirga aurantia]
MKTLTLIVLTIVVLINTVYAQNGTADDPEFPPLEERYLGQKTPGLTPELFAPGFVSTQEHVESLFTFTPDMKEFYFNRVGGQYKETTLFVTQYKNSNWSEPSVLSTDINKHEERFKPGLSELNNLEQFKDLNFTGFTASAKGTYYFYFIDFADGGSGYMSYSRLINGQYEPLQRMNDDINSGTYKAHPFVAPDESYIMWDVEKAGKNKPDIYISFRQPDGTWGPAIDMGPHINTDAYEQRPRVTPDGKYLFFWRGDEKVKEDGSTYWEGNPYWLDARIIETLRPEPIAYPIAYSSKESGNTEIYLTDVEGKSKIKITDYEGGNGYPAWSPDGKQLAFYAKYDSRKTWSIHTMNSDGSNRKRLTHEQNMRDNSPSWSPDGNKIAFSRVYNGDEGDWKFELWIMNPDGSQQTQVGSLSGGAPDFMPDGRLIYNSESEVSEICIVDIDGTNMIQLTNTNAKNWHPEVSPDGKQIAFMSNRDGNFEIYIMDVDGSNQTRLTHNDVRDSTPVWSADGSQILFVSRDEADNNHLYIINKDASSMKRMIDNGGQPAWFGGSK